MNKISHMLFAILMIFGTVSHASQHEQRLSSFLANATPDIEGFRRLHQDLKLLRANIDYGCNSTEDFAKGFHYAKSLDELRKRHRPIPITPDNRNIVRRLIGTTIKYGIEYAPAITGIASFAPTFYAIYNHIRPRTQAEKDALFEKAQQKVAQQLKEEGETVNKNADVARGFREQVAKNEAELCRYPDNHPLKKLLRENTQTLTELAVLHTEIADASAKDLKEKEEHSKRYFVQ